MHRSNKTFPRPTAPCAAAQRSAAHLLPLGALAAGFGLLAAPAHAQTAAAAVTPPAGAASAPRAEATLPGLSVKAKAETDASSVRATTTTIGKGVQDLRDIPQSVTVVTEKLLDDRRVDTLKQALHQTGGVTFMAAEGGEEDVRLRGFSLATSGDIYVDGMRDPAFYDRDTFSYDRVEVLRGSASMLFGRGSTGGVVNQVQKQAFLSNANQVDFTLGNGRFFRLTGDFNLQLTDGSALRINVMGNQADNWGNQVDKQGLALNYRFGIGSNDEVSLSGYSLHNDNGVNYGLPWLRVNAGSADPSTLIPGLDAKVYYAAASDYNAGGARYLTGSWTHRFGGGGELKSTLRYGEYDRDMRASTIRFCVAPTCAGFGTPSLSGPVFVTAATPITRGTNNKVQDLRTAYVQFDYSNHIRWFGLGNELLSGVDLAHEQFRSYAMTLPSGVVLDKNAVRTSFGTPNDGSGWVDESLRIKRQQAAFDAQSIGVYGQDLVQVAEAWKLLAGLRYDQIKGSYQTLQTAASASVPIGAITADRGRSDGLWSKRFGLLYQPSETLSYHASYGTSFNTSGDAYQYDAPGSNTPPEASRNIEVGAKLDLFGGRLSTRFAIYHATKYNERNRDSPTGETLDQYLLSGKRHTAGVDIDIAGRITPQWEMFGSYAWIPVAKVDVGSVPNAAGYTTSISGERQGDRPSLTPRHSGTIWNTYQLNEQFRVGAGLNFRSAQTPNRNPAGIVAPSWITGDLLVDYMPTPQLGIKLNVLNVTNKFYADSLYSGHYIQGAPRTINLTVTTRF